MSCQTKTNVLQPSNNFAVNSNSQRAGPGAVKYGSGGGSEFLGARNAVGRASLKKRRLLPVRDTYAAPAGSAAPLPAVAAPKTPVVAVAGAQPPASVARRNARERNRVKQVIDSFFLFCNLFC